MNTNEKGGLMFFIIGTQFMGVGLILERDEILLYSLVPLAIGLFLLSKSEEKIKE